MERLGGLELPIEQNKQHFQESLNHFNATIWGVFPEKNHLLHGDFAQGHEKSLPGFGDDAHNQFPLDPR